MLHGQRFVAGLEVKRGVGAVERGGQREDHVARFVTRFNFREGSDVRDDVVTVRLAVKLLHLGHAHAQIPSVPNHIPAIAIERFSIVGIIFGASGKQGSQQHQSTECGEGRLA
ncbi:MAG TPA: hypothetical protein DHW55_02040 [Flavobacteriales bacterium]|nr:hypothetical protein [Flavobacteriales bacterium]